MAGPYTMSELGSPSWVHTGVQYNGGVLTISATTTASAIVYLCRVPDGCTILDWRLYFDNVHTTIGGASQVLQIGTSASNSALGSFSTSWSTTTSEFVWLRWYGYSPHYADDLMPVHVSLSDSIAGSDVWLTAKFAVAPSTSGTVQVMRFNVTYTCDGTVGHTTTR